MLLQDYLTQSEAGASSLMSALGVSRAYLYQMATGRRPVTAKRAAVIERVTNGNVSRKDMFPTDWHVIWPELLEQSTEKA